MAEVDWGNCPIGARVEQGLTDMKETLQRIEVLLDKQNGRVRALELWRAYLLGIGIAASFIITLAIKMLWK
jgi:hypothetical protein